MRYQVFISYRRVGGADTAKLIQERLKNEGYEAFYDRDSLKGGYFDERILKAIEECEDFLLILPPNALDRCKNSDDWIRREIKHAIKHKKNIIPIVLPEFHFPEDLPPDIDCIKRINGVKFTLDYFDAVMHTIIDDRMKSKPNKKKIVHPSNTYDAHASYSSSGTSSLTRAIIISVAVLVLVGAFICIFSFSAAGKQLFCSHSFVSSTTEATCVNRGYTTYTCPKCAKVKTDDYTTELGHTWGESVQIQAPSCFENGVQYRKCLACDYHEQVPIQATGHTYSEWIVDKEATNTENGSRHTICTVCNERVDEIVYSAGSQGINYEKNGDHYVVKSIGGCRDINIVIAPNVDGYPVTEIADKAFEGSSIESIIIPEGVVKIGEKAFSGCKKLSEVHMPNSLKIIGKKAFLQCDSLTSVVLPENVTEVANEAFRMCLNLKEFTFSKSISKIGVGCFTDCWALKEVTYNNTVEAWKKVKIGFLAFNTGRFLFGSATIIYCTDGTVKK